MAERLVGVLGGVVSPAVVTVTVTLWLVIPPVPVQLNVYIDVVVMPVIDCEPDVVLAPDHPPLAVQEVALVELHDNVAEPPEVTDVWLAERVRVCVGAVYLVRKSSALHPSTPVS